MTSPTPDDRDPPPDPAGLLRLAIVDALERDVRRGRLGDVLAPAAALPGSLDGEVRDALDALRSDGFAEEVAIVELVRREPVVTALLRRVEAIGAVAALATFVLFVWPAGLFAILPALAARILAGELYLDLLGLQALGDLAPADQTRARVALDLGAYRTGSTKRFGSTEAWLLLVGGAALFAAGLWLRTGAAGRWLVAQVGLAGILLFFSGWCAWSATRRLARSGLRPPGELTDPGPVRRARPAAAALSGPVVVLRPRLGRGMAIALASAALGGLVLVLAGAPVAVAGAVALGIGALLGWRTAGTEVRIGPDGIVDRGVLRTRRWRWDDVHLARLASEDELRRTDALRITTADGVVRPLVEGRAIRQVGDAGALRDSMYHHAASADPGPPARDVGGRAVMLVTLAGLAVLFAVVAGALVARPRTVVVDPSRLRPGDRYVTYARADGSWGPPHLPCPSVIAQVRRADDVRCSGSVRDEVAPSVLLGGLALCLVLAAVLVARSLADLRRRRRAARVARELSGQSGRGPEEDVWSSAGSAS